MIDIVSALPLVLGAVGVLASAFAAVRAPAERRPATWSSLMGAAGIGVSALLAVLLPPISFNPWVIQALVIAGVLAGLTAAAAVSVTHRPDGGVVLRGGRWHLLLPATALLALQGAGLAQSTTWAVLITAALVASAAFALGASLAIVARVTLARHRRTPVASLQPAIPVAAAAMAAPTRGAGNAPSDQPSLCSLCRAGVPPGARYCTRCGSEVSLPIQPTRLGAGLPAKPRRHEPRPRRGFVVSMVLLVGLIAATAATWASWSTIEDRLADAIGTIEQSGSGQTKTDDGAAATDTPDSSAATSQEHAANARDEVTGEMGESSPNGTYAFDSEHYDATTDGPDDFVAGTGTITVDLAAEEAVTGTLWLSFAVKGSEAHTYDWMLDISSPTPPIWDEDRQRWSVSLVITSDESEPVHEDAVIRSDAIRFRNPEFVFVRQ